MFKLRDDDSSASYDVSGVAPGPRWLLPKAVVSLELMAFVLVCVALFQARDVVVPVAFAGLAVLTVYPLYRAMRTKIGRAASVAACFIGVVAVFAALVGLVALCLSQVGSSFSRLKEAVEATQRELPDWLAGFIDVVSGENLGPQALDATGDSVQMSVGIILALAFFTLALLDADRLASRVRESESLLGFADATEEVARNVRQYLIARTVVGLMTGVAVAFGCWGLGIELFLVWGALNFLLNYIPTLGSILAVIPPALFVWATTGSPSEVLLVLGIIGGVQVVMGNYVDPLIQSRFVELSPFGVLLSVVFWGWLWGIAGAFIGVPMTVALLMLCKRSSRYAWVHTALVAKKTQPAG